MCLSFLEYMYAITTDTKFRAITRKTVVISIEIIRSLRAIPFSSSKKDGRLSINSGLNPPEPGDLKLHLSKEIGESEIINLNYGRSDAERFNFFLVVPNQAAMEGLMKMTIETALASSSSGKSTPSISILSNDQSVRRYGLRPYISSTVYQLPSTNAYSHYHEICKDIWDEAVFYENGVVEIVGPEEHIPVGTNIKFKERNWAAHVEGVTYNYAVEPFSGKKSYKTSIFFIRLKDADTGAPLYLDTLVERGSLDPGMTAWPGDEDSNGSESPPFKWPKESSDSSGVTGKPKNKEKKAKKPKKDY